METWSTLPIRSNHYGVSMAYNLFITQNASDEIEEIVDYIDRHLDNRTAAIRFLDKVEDCYSRLKDNPKIYQLCDDQEFKEKGYRKAVINNYVMVYRINEATDTVYILHIFFGRQDYYHMIQHYRRLPPSRLFFADKCF